MGEIPLVEGFPTPSTNPHCMESLHDVRNFLFNVVPGEPFTLVKELAHFPNSIYLDLLLESVIDLCVHAPFNCGLFDAPWVELCWCYLLNNVRCFQQWGKYGCGWSTLNARCRLRNGRMLILKAFSSTTLEMVYKTYQSG